MGCEIESIPQQAQTLLSACRVVLSSIREITYLLKVYQMLCTPKSRFNEIPGFSKQLPAPLNYFTIVD